MLIRNPPALISAQRCDNQPRSARARRFSSLPECFASDPTWLRLAAGSCAQECAHATSVAPLQLLRACVPRLIIDIAASSVAHYGPVEVLRLPVGRPPDDETRPYCTCRGCYHAISSTRGKPDHGRTSAGVGWPTRGHTRDRGKQIPIWTLLDSEVTPCGTGLRSHSLSCSS